MTNEQLHALFVYEPDGRLRRIGGQKSYPWRAIGAKGKYRATTFKGVTYYLHRLVWQYHTGRVPTMVDHINGDTTDNRIENLRECTNAQNQYNSRKKVTNKSGFKGVVKHSKAGRKKWHARIVVEGRQLSLGYYETPEAASAAYETAAKRFAGEFARGSDT